MKYTARQYAEVLLQVTDGKSEAALTSAVQDLVGVLADRHELSRSREIIRAFNNAWRRKYGASEVSITTATEPTKKLIEELQNAFPQASLQTHVDASLVGGAVIQIDDRRFDGSVSGQLRRMFT